MADDPEPRRELFEVDAAVETRSVRAGDLEAAGALLDATLGPGFWGLDTGSPGSHRVAVREGRLLGVASATVFATGLSEIDVPAPVALLRLVAVDVAARGRGLASRLGAASLVAFAWVHAPIGEAPLSGPLRRLGFARDRRIEGFYAEAGSAPCLACGESPCVCPADVYWRAAGLAGA
jgi:GNAT superfamily N-acetyltransferase